MTEPFQFYDGKNCKEEDTVLKRPFRKSSWTSKTLLISTKPPTLREFDDSFGIRPKTSQSESSQANSIFYLDSSTRSLEHKSSLKDTTAMKNNSERNSPIQNKSLVSSQTETIRRQFSPFNQQRSQTEQGMIKINDLLGDFHKNQRVGSEQEYLEIKQLPQSKKYFIHKKEGVFEVSQRNESEKQSKKRYSSLQQTPKDKQNIVVSEQQQETKIKKANNSIVIKTWFPRKKLFESRGQQYIQNIQEGDNEFKKQRLERLQDLRDKTRDQFLNSYNSNLKSEIRMKQETPERIQMCEMSNKVKQRYKFIQQKINRGLHRSGDYIENDLINREDCNIEQIQYINSTSENAKNTQSFYSNKCSELVPKSLIEQNIRQISPVSQRVEVDPFPKPSCYNNENENKTRVAIPVKLNSEVIEIQVNMNFIYFYKKRKILEEMDEFSSRIKAQKQLQIKNQKQRKSSKGFCGMTLKQNAILINIEGLRKIKQNNYKQF